VVDIHHEGSAQAPLDVAFAFVDDYTQTPGWMFGLTEFNPVGAQTQGQGAVFNLTFTVPPVKLHSTVKIIEWVRDDRIRMQSTEGFVNRSLWRFHAVGETETRIVVDFTYELPGGLAGKALGKLLEPIVGVAIRQSEAALRTGIEKRWAGRQ
jgi:uncharacterized membrane protein